MNIDYPYAVSLRQMMPVQLHLWEQQSADALQEIVYLTSEAFYWINKRTQKTSSEN